jgi:hypothetical protein
MDLSFANALGLFAPAFEDRGSVLGEKAHDLLRRAAHEPVRVDECFEI